MYETIMGDINGDRFELDGSHLDNTLIKEAVDKCYNNRNEENMFNVLDTLLTRIKEGGLLTNNTYYGLLGVFMPYISIFISVFMV